MVSVLAVGILTLATAYASPPTEMALLRLLAGMGMGAAVPYASPLLLEYAPQRRRSLMITVMFTGLNLGSALIGFAAGYLIPLHGWRSVLFLGGAVPLALVPILVLFLPESARLLALRGAGSRKVAATLGRVTGHRFSGGETFVSAEPPVEARKPIGLLVIHLLTGWLPTLMKDAGLSIATAANVTAMFQIGGTIGAIVAGWAMDGARPALVIAAAYLCGGLCILAVSLTGALSSALAVLVFSAGFCMSGAQTGLNAFAPELLPHDGARDRRELDARHGALRQHPRFGRRGALLGLGWGFGAILAVLAIPAVYGAVAIALTQRRSAGAAAMEAAAH